MSRQLACLAALVLAAAACAPDATAPAAARGPEPSARLASSVYGYRATVLPLRYGKAINNAGAVVGTLPGPDQQGVYYANGASTLLLPITPFNRVAPVDLTDDGRIIAQEQGPDGGSRALYYPGPTLSAVDIAPSARWAHPAGINHQGVVVGWSLDSGDKAVGFRWTAGSSGVTSIHPAGCEESFPLDISESGYVTGEVRCDSTPRWYRWNQGGASGVLLPSNVRLALQTLESGRVLVRHPPHHTSAIWAPPSTFSDIEMDEYYLFHVSKISLNGRYIGYFVYPSTGSVFAWTSLGPGTVTFLPEPAGFVSARVTDVNACGTILGEAREVATGETRAIVWSRSFTCDPPLVATAGAF